ncbi:P-loop NTPase fold protein [Sulfuricurvum sp.]|uniref:P-loop NTPase fold protein n=1 Tax=Sulfuricurvum sp. TaxID=2025608 RepID=UPI00261CB6BA|nr:P-loop NTPase fold protein [Sulfuricurvum sp.]MDD3598149.1 P-loop NTPase fold protein [Sulfuricurvum sp.]
MAIINQHINEFLDYYLNLNEPQYAVLLSGKWGSGKTHFIKQFKEENKSSYKFIHISLFGLKSKEDIHKQVIFKLFGLENDNLAKATDFIGKFIKGILNKYAGVNIALSDIPIDVALKRESNQKVIFIFDDLERIDTGLSEVLGYINVLVEELGQRIILLANEDEIKDRLFYDTFKEKTIGKTFQIEQDFETAFETFLEKLKNSKQILQANQSDIKNIFDMAGYQNLRSLRQGLLDFDRLMESFDEKFKTHHELMKEFIQIFFALIFEIKSGKLDIQTLRDMTMFRIGRMLNEKKSDQELTTIEKVFQKYNFLSDELLLPNENWILFFTKGILHATEISTALNRSRYFLQEQREEWVKLWHYMWLEQEEFQNSLQETYEKIAKNEYQNPVVVLHVAGILLSLSDREMIIDAKAKIIDDLKSYIDLNTKNWNDLEKVDYYELSWNHLGLGYMSEDTEEFRLLRDYLVDTAEEVRREGLKDKGDLLITYLNENNIDGFLEMLIAEKNKEILYRLPVFRYIEPKVFFDALIQVKNKHIRDVLNILTKRYQSIFAYEKEPVLEELDFWKEILIIANNHQVKIPYEIKDVWIKTHFKSIVENDIIQKIEKQLQQIEKEKNNV